MRLVQEEIRSFLSTPPYHACLILVYKDIVRLERTMRDLLMSASLQRCSIGFELSDVLLLEPAENWPRRAAAWVSAKLHCLAPGPVICSEIDLLFDPALELDPLALFRQISRTTVLIVAWPGSYAKDVLAYGVPEHAHYHAWTRPDVEVIFLD